MPEHELIDVSSDFGSSPGTHDYVVGRSDVQRRQCEGCRGSGGNWDCEGENDPEDCNCSSCTGNEDCPECDGHGAWTC